MGATRFVLFLHGRYLKSSIEFYRFLCKNATTVAVDGGLAFFKKAGVSPDILIGDLDSAGKLPRKLLQATQVITFPTRKDKTDSELALRQAVESGATSIDIVNPEIGQPDHFLGNIMLLSLGKKLTERKKSRTRVRLVNHDWEMRLLYNESWTFTNCVGGQVSVLPQSASIKLSCTGFDYNVDQLRVRQGESRGLRNLVLSKRARLRVHGKALVVHRFHPQE